MRRAVLLGLAMCGGAIGLSACRTGPTARPIVEPPALTELELEVVSQSLTDCVVKLTGALAAGGQRVDADLAKVELLVDGQLVQTTEAALGLAVPAGEKAPFALEQRYTYAKDAAEVEALDARGGALLVALRGRVLARVLGAPEQPAVPFELEFARAREVRVPRHPKLKLKDFEAARFGPTEAQIVLHLAVVNPNNFPLPIGDLTYEVLLAGKKAGEGTLGAGDSVAPAATGIFDITVSLSRETHGEQAARLVKARVVPYELRAALKAPLVEERLEVQGEIKLNSSK